MFNLSSNCFLLKINDDFKAMFQEKHNKLISSWSYTFVDRLVVYAQSLNDSKVSQLLILHNTSTDDNGNKLKYLIIILLKIFHF